MTRKFSHLFSLFESLCETLTECARVDRCAKKDTYAARKSLEIRAATEPLAISCLDEEFCDVPRAVGLVYTSCSIPLIDHLRSLTARSVYMSQTDWSMILLSAKPDLVEKMLDRGLNPAGGILPMVYEIRAKKMDWTDLLMRRVASKAALEEEELNTLVALKHDNATDHSVQVVANVLRAQADAFPVILSDVVAKSLRDQTSIGRAIACILAGVPAKDIISKSRPENALCDTFLARMSSNHGALSLHQTFGSLEAFIYDLRTRRDYIDSLTKEFSGKTLISANQE